MNILSYNIQQIKLQPSPQYHAISDALFGSMLADVAEAKSVTPHALTAIAHKYVLQFNDIIINTQENSTEYGYPLKFMENYFIGLQMATDRLRDAIFGGATVTM